MAWVTGAEILTQVRNGSPSADDTAWAEACAAAVDAGFNQRLAGALLPDGPVDPNYAPELHVAAINAGVEAYKRREAAFGLTGYVDLQGAAVRVARDYLEAQSPIIARYATFGFA